jgi:hypothetical protein
MATMRVYSPASSQEHRRDHHAEFLLNIRGWEGISDSSELPFSGGEDDGDMKEIEDGFHEQSNAGGDAFSPEATSRMETYPGAGNYCVFITN